MLDESGKFLDDPKEVSNLMNKVFVYIADNLLKDRMNGVHENSDKWWLHTVKWL